MVYARIQSEIWHTKQTHRINNEETIVNCVGFVKLENLAAIAATSAKVIGVGNRLHNIEKGIAMTIFDTDFSEDAMILVYERGKIVYASRVCDMTPKQKEDYQGFDWYMLANYEDYTAVFIG